MDAVSSPDAPRRIRLLLTVVLAIAAVAVVAILMLPQTASAPLGPGPAEKAVGAASSSPPVGPSSSTSATPAPSLPATKIEMNPPGLDAAQPATTSGGRPIIRSCSESGPQDQSGTVPPVTWDAGRSTAKAHPGNGLIVGIHGTHVMTLDPRTGTLTRIAEFGDGVSGGAQWSPTGAALAITGSSGFGFMGCSSVDVLSSGQVVRLATARGTSDATWAPDGASIAVFSRSNWAYASDGAATGLPSCGPECAFDSFSYAPDGRHIVARRVYNDEHADIALITVKSGDVRVLPGSKGLGLDGWLDARTLLLDARSRDGRARWVADRLDGKRTPAHLAIDASAVARLVLEPSPDLRSAAGSECIWCPFIVLHGGVPRVVWTGHPPMDQAWSPDSRWIAFTVRGSKAVRGTWVVRADGTHRHRISPRILDQMDWGVAPR